jgi:hypothetical protein
MANPNPFEPAKLICGMIAPSPLWFDRAESLLVATYGPVDVASEIIPFDMTNYYEPQMGPGLLRKFVAFEQLIDPQQLADIKHETNSLEQQLAACPDAIVGRPVNLDPGYLALSKLVLASMKDFAHRIALRDGAFAEITLQYQNGWQSLPWTFPDYASGRYDDFLTNARNALRG